MQEERLPLVVPVTALRDKVRRKVLNVDGYDFKELSDVAGSIYSRRQLLEIGSNPIDIGDPAVKNTALAVKLSSRLWASIARRPRSGLHLVRTHLPNGRKGWG